MCLPLLCSVLHVTVVASSVCLFHDLLFPLAVAPVPHPPVAGHHQLVMTGVLEI